jgi:hypothetical protein
MVCTLTDYILVPVLATRTAQLVYHWPVILQQQPNSAPAVIAVSHGKDTQLLG